MIATFHQYFLSKQPIPLSIYLSIYKPIYFKVQTIPLMKGGISIYSRTSIIQTPIIQNHFEVPTVIYVCILTLNYSKAQ